MEEIQKKLHVSPFDSLEGDIVILCGFHLRITQHCVQRQDCRSIFTILLYSVADLDPDP
jgi:hypothetical protein